MNGTDLYRWALRPLLFSLPPDAAHALAFAAMAPIEGFAPLRACVRALLAPSVDPRLAVRTMGLHFAHPLGLAAGFDKDARRPRALAALGFAHLELGTVTALPQEANPRPNLFRLPRDRGLVNRLGFPNAGAARLAARLAAAKPALAIPIGVSIGKSRAVAVADLDAVVADYAASFDAVRDVADFVVVNVSSPNTAGLRSMQSETHARTLLSSLAGRAAGRPLLVKIAPDLSDPEIETLLAVVEAAGLAGVVATNTTIARDGLATDKAHVDAIGAGGLSGPRLRARALDVVRRVRARLGRGPTVIGVGGIEGPEHAMEFVRAGANLVQMYTGFVYEGPAVAGHVVRGIAATMEREGAGSVAELVGC
jgi:dihydroorotate dehydrogenase